MFINHYIFSLISFLDNVNNLIIQSHFYQEIKMEHNFLYTILIFTFLLYYQNHFIN